MMPPEIHGELTRVMREGGLYRGNVELDDRHFFSQTKLYFRHTLSSCVNTLKVVSDSLEKTPLNHTHGVDRPAPDRDTQSRANTV